MVNEIERFGDFEEGKENRRNRQEMKGKRGKSDLGKWEGATGWQGPVQLPVGEPVSAQWVKTGRERERDRTAQDSVSGKERPGRAKNRHLGGWGLGAEGGGQRARGSEREGATGETGERHGKRRETAKQKQARKARYRATRLNHRGRSDEQALGQARQDRQTTGRSAHERRVSTHYLTAKLRSIAASPPSGQGAILAVFKLFCLFSGPQVSCQQVFVGG